MQRFIAELSSLIDKGKFETSWQSDSSINSNLTVDFGFDGRRVSISIKSSVPGRWQSENFRWTFSNAVRRVDEKCTVTWI